jgi:tRNA(Ile)-lysidine synthase TilS/MesJ
LLFHEKNNIQSKYGTNNWIPFTEQEVNASEKFESNFMTNFIAGKIKSVKQTGDILFDYNNESSVSDNKPLLFSDEATAVFDAGRKLWKYYHAQNGVNVNASLYDIREYFQGRNEQGRMNAKSNDETYTQLIGDLREKLNVLATKIKPKVYEYGFLKE